MKIAVASGKGGTGKTTIALNLALCLADKARLAHKARLADTLHPVTYVDCDVEEPNGHIFLKPKIEITETDSVPVPKVDEAACTACGECSRICQFSAIVCLGSAAMTFPELCKGCGGCFMVCHDGALTEAKRAVGKIEKGSSGPLGFLHGKLRVGEAMSPPLIRRLKAEIPTIPASTTIPKEGIVILDAPPGTSCPVVETVRDADFVLLVTEPTPFGLNDLELAVAMVRLLRVPFAVGVNRAGSGDDRVERYCRKEDIPILFELDDDRRISTAYSRGELLISALPEYRGLFDRLGSRILEMVS